MNAFYGFQHNVSLFPLKQYITKPMQDNCELVIATQSLYQTAAVVIIKDRESFIQELLISL